MPKGRKLTGIESRRALRVGASVLIRTVTHYYTGSVAFLDKEVVVLNSAAWVADTKRWADTLRTGELNEVEPYPDGPVEVFRAAIVDVCLWAHELPRTQK